MNKINYYFDQDKSLEKILSNLFDDYMKENFNEL